MSAEAAARAMALAREAAKIAGVDPWAEYEAEAEADEAEYEEEHRAEEEESRQARLHFRQVRDNR